jgi:E1-E2 ATPase
MVTGESMPVTKEAGAVVIGATLNQTGAFRMRATKVGRDTMLAQIVRRFNGWPVARWFVPAVLFVAIATFVVWFNLGPTPAFQFALVAAVAVLIIACPYAYRPANDALVHRRPADMVVLLDPPGQLRRRPDGVHRRRPRGALHAGVVGHYQGALSVVARVAGCG